MLVIKKYLNIGIGVIFLLLIITSSSLFYLYKNQLKENGVKTEKIETLTKEIDSLNSAILDEQSRHKELSQSRSQLYKDFINTKRELDSKKGNVSKVVANPKELETLIQSSFDLYLKDVSCVTGELSQCE